MTRLRLQKSAPLETSDSLPKEILNPLKAAEQYDLRMYSPCADLADFVDEYWILRWDLRGKQPFTCEVIPSPYINLTFMSEGARITGVTTGKYSYEVSGIGKIIGAKFKPGGFRPFWRDSVHELTDTTAPALRIFSEIDDVYNNAMLAMTSDKATIEQFEKLLLAYSPTPDKNIDLIENIIQSLDIDDCITVQSVARKFGVSERYLQELFRTYVGVGIKWIISRVRLQKAAGLAAKLESPNWAEVATQLGYNDQSHFVNDFKKIIGKPPAQYATIVRSKD